MKIRAKGQEAASKIKETFRQLDSFTKEQNDQLLASAFEQAKKVSDFIGMIIRLSFSILAYSFFFDRAAKASNSLIGFMYGVSAIATAGLSIYFALLIFRVILIYEMKRAIIQTNRYMKIIMVLSTIILFYGAYIGILELARTIAASGKIPG